MMLWMNLQKKIGEARGKLAHGQEIVLYRSHSFSKKEGPCIKMDIMIVPSEILRKTTAIVTTQSDTGNIKNHSQSKVMSTIDCVKNGSFDKFLGLLVAGSKEFSDEKLVPRYVFDSMEVKKLKKPLAMNKDKSSKNVTFKEQENKMYNGDACTWNVYTAPTKNDATDFLKKNPIDKRFYFLVVETPYGNFCRDINGFYEE